MAATVGKVEHDHPSMQRLRDKYGNHTPPQTFAMCKQWGAAAASAAIAEPGASSADRYRAAMEALEEAVGVKVRCARVHGGARGSDGACRLRCFAARRLGADRMPGARPPCS